MGKVYTAKQLRKIIEADGWCFVYQKGSHEQYHHKTKSGVVTIPNHKGDIPKSTANNILKQAGLK